MAMRIGSLFVLLFVSSALLGQSKTPATSSQPINLHLQSQVADLQSQVARLTKQIESLTGQLSWDEYHLKHKQNRQDSITLDLTDHAFQRVDTDTGFFLVSVVEAVPYLNGYKLRLMIGNPSHATYSAAKLKVTWNKVYNFEQYTEASYNEWQKSEQEKETPLTETLDAGTWNKVEIVLAPATIEQLGVVTFSMNTDTIFLDVK
jgi:hypothetical protein